MWHGIKSPIIAMGQGGSNIVSGGAEAMVAFYGRFPNPSVVLVVSLRNGVYQAGLLG